MHMAMLARPQIEILSDTEILLTERELSSKLPRLIPAHPGHRFGPRGALGEGANTLDFSASLGFGLAPSERSLSSVCNRTTE